MVLTESFVRDVIQHMNSDHQDSLRDYAMAYGGVAVVDRIELVDLSTHEMVLQCDSGNASQLLRIPLISQISRPEQVRGVMVAMAKKARQQLST